MSTNQFLFSNVPHFWHWLLELEILYPPLWLVNSIWLYISHWTYFSFESTILSKNMFIASFSTLVISLRVLLEFQTGGQNCFLTIQLGMLRAENLFSAPVIISREKIPVLAPTLYSFSIWGWCYEQDWSHMQISPWMQMAKSFSRWEDRPVWFSKTDRVTNLQRR